jgi:hypothetical protein
MRRMLHRCNTAIRKDSRGTTVYAPRIASELARQLDEWHSYLPGSIQFSPTNFESPNEYLLTKFLHVQYHCYKISTYWPAVYQAIRDRSADENLLEDCQTFLASYITLIPSLITSLRDCMVNRWTLFATSVSPSVSSPVIVILISRSMFMTSMAVLKVVNTPWLRATCSPQLFQILTSAGSANFGFVSKSASLKRMHEALKYRLATTYDPVVGGNLLPDAAHECA